MRHEVLCYEADGLLMRSQLFFEPASSPRASVLVFPEAFGLGADDPFIPAAHRNAFESEMRDAGADWEIHVYGNTVHSFTNQEAAKRGMPDTIRYSPEADLRSWKSMLELFSESLENSVV